MLFLYTIVIEGGMLAYCVVICVQKIKGKGYTVLHRSRAVVVGFFPCRHVAKVKICCRQNC